MRWIFFQKRLKRNGFGHNKNLLKKYAIFQKNIKFNFLNLKIWKENNFSLILRFQIGAQYILPVVHQQVGSPESPGMNADAVHVAVLGLVPHQVVVFPVLNKIKQNYYSTEVLKSICVWQRRYMSFCLFSMGQGW